MKLHDYINLRIKELGMKRGDLVDKGGLAWSTLSLIKNNKYIGPVTVQKLAKVLECTAGDIQACMAEQNPLKDVVVNKKSLAKKKPKPEAPAPDPEEPTAEPEADSYGFKLPEGKWYPDIEEVKKDTSTDMVNHPAHYTAGSIECIDAIKASMTKEQFAGYLKGNSMKYMWRYQHKGGVEDLQKARWYLDRLISEVE